MKNITEILEKEAKELLSMMHVKAEVMVREENGAYSVGITSDEDAPLLIGKYGETLQAIQRILEAILYKAVAERVDIAVNINDYRERQKERLAHIAERTAQKVKEEGREAYLHSFSAYERKIIHEYITHTHPELTSYSEGEGDERKIIISPKT
ncbi:MAG TPA: R3H domain-containing nucleic acid-binding protein [Patescibacteria group bacterium]|nr:R3H domain-containing nucleic acid-binding protein [Patescibacteria group bacterium]